ncbi:MAG TPA: DNA internalization-related competence protein ComEC/Rec2 [Candidatus Binatia bacterium]
MEALLGDESSTGGAIAITGRVVDLAPTFGDGVKLTLAVETADDAAASGLLGVSLHETSRRWRTGDRIALRSRLRRIRGFGNFGEPDWAAYNARRGIFASAAAWSDGDVTVLDPRDGVVDRLRRLFSDACDRVGGQGAEILEALVIGDRTGIDATTSIAIRDAGLAHFLAISGSHMALIVAIVVAVVRGTAGLSLTLLERFDVMKGAALAAALAIVGYGAICGGDVSVYRSELMALAAMAALWRGRPANGLRALAGSAIVLALAMPGVAEEAGFQLSYVAVVALVLDARQRRVARDARIGELRPVRAASAGGVSGAQPGAATRAKTVATTARRLCGGALRLTLVCWAVTTPIVAHHFERISLVAPVANLLAAPLVSAVVVSGLGGLLLLPVLPGAGVLLVRAGAFLSSLIVGVATFCASLPYASLTTPTPGPSLTVALTGLVLLGLLPSGAWRRRSQLMLAATALACIAVGARDRWRGDRLDAWFASVGQGDAAVVRMPGGKVWVVDEGSPGRGRMVVAPLLRQQWIGRVDVLVASHVQSDHAGALTEILDEFDVGEIWIPDGPCQTPAAAAIERDAARRRVPLRRVSRDDAPPHEDGVEVLWPPRGAAACNDNDHSQVLAFSFAGRRLLFTGDIEAPAEIAIAASRSIGAEVLKVPHHGSRTSSTESFLSAVAPQLAVISLGIDNQFHFPAPAVEDRYAAHDTAVARTDRDGAVHVTVARDGSVSFETFDRGGPVPVAGPSSVGRLAPAIAAH